MEHAIPTVLRRIALAASAVAAIGLAGGALTACGGGDPTPDCTVDTLQFGYPDLIASPYWVVGEADLGVPVSDAPSLQGVGAACLTGKQFTVLGDTPPGLTVNADTGVISGTPTTAGAWVFSITVSVPRLPSGRAIAVQMQVRDPAAFGYAGWDDATGGHALPSGGVHLDTLGDALILTQDGVAAMQTTRSTDGGATWVVDMPATAPSLRDGPAIASDGAHLVLVGGQDASGMRDDVWVYDGVDWVQAAAHAPFGPRTGPVLFVMGASLFLTAGYDELQGYDDLWRSDDVGQTWTKVSDQVIDPMVPATPDCGADLNGTAVIVSSRFNFGTGTHPDTFLWSSTDGGVTWQGHDLPVQSPFDTLNGGNGQCAVIDGRLYVTGADGYWGTVTDIVATSDLDHWDFQPASDAFLGHLGLPGNAVLAGRLYLGFGGTLYTSH